MINLGLSSSDLAKFQASLTRSYELKITLQLMDLNHKPIANISHMLLDGQVNRSYWEWITSTASLTLLDPDGLIGFDTQSPSDGALYADRMIRVYASVYSEILPRWVDVPLITGRVADVDRDDALVTVDCEGKESLYMAPQMAWWANTYPAGMRRTTAIRDALTRSGEWHFDFPEDSTRLPKPQPVKTETPVWQAALWMSGSRHTRQLFYNGRGVAVFRPRSPRPMFRFTEDHLTSVPRLDYDNTTLRNTVIVKGAMVGTKQLIAIRSLPNADPQSAYHLARNGVPQRFVELVEDSSLTKQSLVDDTANDTLASVKIGSTGFDWSCVPIWHLEPGDTVALATRDIGINLLADKFSLPLKPDEGTPMSMGDHRRISVNYRKLRRK